MTSITVRRSGGAAVAARSADAIAQLYADDIEIWHSFDDETQEKTRNVVDLASLFASVAAAGYRDVRRTPIPGGVLQQHVLFVRTFAGDEVAVPVCMVLKLRGGQIVRMEEYVDPSPFHAIMQEAASAGP